MKFLLLIVDDDAPGDGGTEKAEDLLYDSLNNPTMVVRELGEDRLSADIDLAKQTFRTISAPCPHCGEYEVAEVNYGDEFRCFGCNQHLN